MLIQHTFAGLFDDKTEESFVKNAGFEFISEKSLSKCHAFKVQCAVIDPWVLFFGRVDFTSVLRGFLRRAIWLDLGYFAVVKSRALIKITQFIHCFKGQARFPMQKSCEELHFL